MLLFLLVITIFSVFYLLKRRRKVKNLLIKEEVESFGRDVKRFFSPIEGLVKSISQGSFGTEITLKSSFFCIQKLISPIDAEVTAIKYFKAKNPFVFWNSQKRQKYLHIELQVWSDYKDHQEWSGVLILLCYTWFGRVQPIVNMGDLVKQNSPLSQRSIFKKVKIIIPKYLNNTASVHVDLKSYVIQGSNLLER